MLKSLELKNEVKELRDKINGLIEQKAEIPAELQTELSDKLEEYAAQVQIESKNKVIKGENTMDRKVFNKALKNYLMGIQNEETMQVFNAAKGNNGAVTADGGALIPEELLALRENNGNLFNRVYLKDVNKSILAEAAKGATSKSVTALASKAGLDAIKQAVISLPLDAGGNATVVMNQSTFAALAVVADKQDRYLLVRDANNATIREIEGRPVIVVEDDELAANTVLVGDFRAMYHIAYPELEVMADESAGFTRNSVLVRAVCRFQDINTYDKAFAVVKQGA